MTEAAKQYLTDEGYDPVFGARPLKRIMQKQLINEISTKILEGDFQQGDSFEIDCRDDKLSLKKIKNQSELNHELH